MFVRAGGWRGGHGAHLRCDAGGKLPVDDEAKCRGGEHGENWVTPEHTVDSHNRNEKEPLVSSDDVSGAGDGVHGAERRSTLDNTKAHRS